MDMSTYQKKTSLDDRIIFMKPGKQNVSTQFFTSKSFKESRLQKYVGFIHAFTGCDTTSCFYGKGKKKLHKILLDNQDLLPLVDSFYDEKTSSVEVAECGSEIIARLYGTKAENKKKISLLDLRYKHFETSTIKDNFKLECLPPSKGAAAQHSYRVYHQLQTWLGLKKDATEWGWKPTSNVNTKLDEIYHDFIHEIRL
ncbi:hypothetical protein QAD02_021805 [Eretmocerus hayati]|uniref:Uncharacterized protein n=1 Tax=Eretmocerus hayati TaxID=131215 RepID=A0ACC2PRI2_9HYME|nr:hypothetical protein QAD02_021805 [Eretmocerus hayati]